MSADLDSERLAEQALEGSRMPRRRPQFELRIAAGAYLQEGILTAIVQLDARQVLRVAAVEAFGQAQNCRERPHGPAALARELREVVVAKLGRRTPVIPRDQRNGVDLFRLEAAQVAVLDQVVRVPVMAFVADVHADIVKHRGVLEPFALAIGQAVHTPRLLEDRHGEARDLVGVLRPVVAALSQLDDAAAADVGVAIGLRDLFSMARDVVEDEPFTQRHVAERDVLGAQPPNDRVEQDGAGDSEICPAGLKARDAKPPLETQLDKLLPYAPQLLRGDAPVSESRAGRSPVLA